MLIRSKLAAVGVISLAWSSGASYATAPARTATFYLAEVGLCSHDWRLTTAKVVSAECPATVVDGQSRSTVGVASQVYAAKPADLRRLRLDSRHKLAFMWSARAIAPARLPVSGGPTDQPDYVDTAGLADATVTVTVNGATVLAQPVLEVLDPGVIRSQTFEAALPSRLNGAAVRSLVVTVRWANAIDAAVWTDGAWRSSLSLPVT